MRKAKPSARPAPAGAMRSKAYLHIQRKIASGDLAVGAALSEPVLARELGTSRTPVREAIGQLVSEGFLEQTPNRGTVVVRLSRHDIIELYELREALEVYAVTKTAREPVRASELEQLQTINADTIALKSELDRARKPELDTAQMHRLMTADLAFHTLLMRMAGNARILKVVNETRLLIRIFSIRHRGHRSAEIERIHGQHRDILNAIAAHKPSRAAKLLSEHIQASRRERLDEYDYWEREDSLRRTIPELLLPLGTLPRSK